MSSHSGKVRVGVILLVLAGLLLVWSVSVYNSLVRMEEDVKTALSQVDVQLQRRFDLIPNLTASVQGIFNQEQEVFTALAEARTRYSGARSATGAGVGSGEYFESAQGLETALSRLLVVVENYPELRSSETVLSLMDELAGTENRISTERGRYNESVNVFNKRRRVFPGSLVAAIMSFEEKARFEAVEGSDTAPAVKFE